MKCCCKREVRLGGDSCIRMLQVLVMSDVVIVIAVE